ncbi:LysR family transcriptional regulator [Nocardioides marmoraquaticus]
MDPHRLRLLLDLSRLGSMREVAEERRLSTSAVSQQLAALAREAGTPLLEPVGRRVRLTPAGRRLADHAVRILAAVDAARLDLDPGSEPVGTVRVGGFATAVRRALLPALPALAADHPGVRVVVSEYEPQEAFALLLRDDLDLALTYDYDLAPALLPADVVAAALWRSPWGLGVPATAVAADQESVDLRDWATSDWILNSRNTADEEAVRTLANLAGFTPRTTHFIDSLELVESLVVAGLGVGLLPLDRRPAAGVRVLPIAGRGVELTSYAVTRRGREQWSPLRTVVERLHR